MTESSTQARGTSTVSAPPDWAVVLLTGSAMFVLLDITRILFPSIAFIYGRVGSSPASEMGVFALILFVTAGLVGRVAGVNSSLSAPVAVGTTLLLRGGLVLVDGGNEQLLVASLSFVSVIGLLGALAASDIPARHAARGLALGLLASISVHAMLDTRDSVSIGGAISWLVTAAVAMAMLWAIWYVRPTRETPPIRTTLPWLLIGPVIAIQGIAAGTHGALRGAWGETDLLPAVLLVAASGVGHIAGRYVTSTVAREFAGPIVLALAGLTAVPLLGGARPGAAAVASLMTALLATLALTVSGAATDDPLASRGRRSAAAGLGMMLAFLIVFGYYASYELQIGFPRGLLPAAGAGLIGFLVDVFKPTDEADPKPTTEDVATVAFASFVLVFVVIAAQTGASTTSFQPLPDNVRVMTWNVHMGYDDLGRFNPDRIADVIAAETPDIVVLNEVDRGWMIGGGHDLLEILTEDLGMHYAFGPAADAIWGNAILSRYPLQDVTVTTLPGDAPMNRSVMSAIVTIGGSTLGVIATHLHHLEDGDEIRELQANEVSSLAVAFETIGTPVVIMGDLNAVPGSPALGALSGFADMAALAADGRPIPTFPATNPTRQLDHILASLGITARNLAVPLTTASDHLPIAVTLDLTG